MTPTPNAVRLEQAIRQRDWPTALRLATGMDLAAVEAILSVPVMDLDSITARHNGTATSRAAASTTAPRLGSRVRRILDLIADSPRGQTDEEIEQALGLSHQTASSARNGLMNAGWIEQARDPQTHAPITRPTSTGNQAAVWRLTNKAARLGISLGSDDW